MGKTSLDLSEARDDGDKGGMAVAPAGPFAKNLHLAADRLPHQHIITQFLQAFLPPNQQCQSTEGK